MSELTITVTIADRPYRLTIRREEEERVRKAAKLINDQMDAYGKAYAFNDQQDLLAMSVLQFATSAVKAEENTTYREKQLEDKLKMIDTMLDEHKNGHTQVH